MMNTKTLLIAAVAGAAILGTAAPEAANARGMIIRDHRGPSPIVRDHRTPTAPIVRDHRTTTAPIVRDHRTSSDVIVRDHRTTNVIVRDHRTTETLRDKDGHRIPGRARGREPGQMLCHRTPSGGQVCHKL